MSITLPANAVPALTEPARSTAILDLPRPATRTPAVLGMVALLAFAAGFAGWSTMAPLSEAAIAPGVLRNENNRRIIAHLEGGIIREILVRDGDQVRVGQPLLRLDDVASAANRDALRSQRWSLLAQDARAQAEIAGAASVAFAPELLALTDLRAREAVEGQRLLFAARDASLRSGMQVQEARIVQFNAAIAASVAQVASQRRQLELLRQEERDVNSLVRQGLERMPRLLGLQRQIASAEGNIADLSSQAERARAQIAEAQSALQGLRDQRLQEVTAEAREVRTKLAEMEERLRAADDVSARREITAPEDGTVLNSRFFNPGAVVRPGEPVIDLIPARERLIAEVRVMPTDIDTVMIGQQAEMRLPSFKARTIPYIHGEVFVVASDVTTEDRTGMQYYRVQIRVDENQVAHLPEVQLRVGMPVEAQIKTGERSFLRYMIQPLLDSFHRAFKEQ
jgi:HlyD family type I secretion membrane fusion protein